MKKKPVRTCLICGKKAAHDIIATQDWSKGSKKLVLKVPAVKCEACGEQYVTWKTQGAIDRERINAGLLPHRHLIQVKVGRRKREFVAATKREGKWVVARCFEMGKRQELDIDIASHGRTKKQALENLAEAIELYFEEMEAAEDREDIRDARRILKKERDKFIPYDVVRKKLGLDK